MRWLKGDTWKAGIALAGLLLLLVLMVWIPMSANAYGGASEVAMAGTATVQATPTVDVTATITALNEEKLRQEIQQLKNQDGDQNNWLANNSTALIAAVATVIVALFGILQWAITVRQTQDKELRDRADAREKERAAQDKELKDRQEAQDKELRAQVEERFKTAVTALGSENEATQVGGAILLRSFLKPEDKEIYGRYYTQIFDLAVAYLRLPRTTHSSGDSDKPFSLLEQSDIPQPLTPLSRVLIVVFQEAFPLARSQNKGRPQSLDASSVLLDNAFLNGVDLKQAWMRQASLRKAKLRWADLSGIDLFQTNLSEAKFRQANLSGASFVGAKLVDAELLDANLRKADLHEADLRGADLSGADLMGADLRGTRLENALSLKDTDLRCVKGLTKEQLEACKAKGAIIDEDTTTDSSQPD